MTPDGLSVSRDALWVPYGSIPIRARASYGACLPVSLPKPYVRSSGPTKKSNYLSKEYLLRGPVPESILLRYPGNNGRA